MTTTKSRKFYSIEIRSEHSLTPLNYHQLVDDPSFCAACGQPLRGIQALPDIPIKKRYKYCVAYGIRHYRGTPVDAMKISLIEELSKFINVEDFFILGNLLDSENEQILEYKTFLPRHYLFIRGSTFFKKTCDVCGSFIYAFYRDPYIPLSFVDCAIPIFGSLGGGLVVNEEIALHLKSLKLRCLSIWKIKIHEELPQNMDFPLYESYF